ncbi:sensor histidine kinase [Leeuwenhoekiella parthenopeia]|uniref:histidine kinase n=1 Tax=Leeuwenhoekiella parthenopeia TaxID=2890320 RepID=A0ABS8GRI7_9FLAO|nr:HAMP domain-containing sensor histidine kinase [Leeuwenhoekiella parthenopeia]MCC4212358.1 HAMP domain-containing histidine kinase [Leeuwenhoekiella parthenopeia]
MNKNLFVLLVVLMSLSLIGIIFVQGYWISNSIEAKRGQFAFNAKQVLKEVSREIQIKEVNTWYNPILRIRDSLGVPDDISLYDLVYKTEDSLTNESQIFRNSIVEQNYKLSAPVLDYEVDSIRFKRYLQRQYTQIIDKNDIDKTDVNRTTILNRMSDLSDIERFNIEQAVMYITRKIPIHKRVSEEEITRLLTMELAERDMDTRFAFAIYSNNLVTNVRSDDFDIESPEQNFSVPLFSDSEGNSDYQLVANFPGEKKYVVSSVVGMGGLSILFTLIIVIAYSSALQQLVKQRQISQIKTDFINNMTHEFKTPIATINLALDAIRNPKISGNPEMLNRYMGMIREENKRMHAQVENVLRISKLEKNELDIKKERVKLHDLIEDAVTHIELLVEDREGYVKQHLGAVKSSVLANESHFTNVLVNILDNAVKYSSEPPKIDIYTENLKNFILVKIKDQGDGMSKQVQKKIFDKFYREHTGDIHNVKGHGLGLSYAKRIVEDHAGQIWVQSEKGKGSTFIIKLPLIS